MKGITRFLLCMALLCCLLWKPVATRGLTPLEPDRDCSLTLYYTQEGIGFGGLEIQIFRVAEAFPDGSFRLIAPFSDYPVNIYGITAQKEWQEVASTLHAYIAANQVAPIGTETTQQDGTAVFSGLQTGLYLVRGAVAENQKGTYQFNDFMVYLPTPGENGYDYDVEAKPKCRAFVPHTQYSVVKLWKDVGNETQRPKSVTVEIRKDGVFVEEVILSAKNDWSYHWTVPDGQGRWSVVEKDVPRDYQVSISENDTAFVITNTHAEPGNPPETGDVFASWQMILMMCISGLVFVLLGIWRERKQR